MEIITVVRQLSVTFNNSRIRMMNYKRTEPISQNQNIALWLMNNCVSYTGKLRSKENNLMSFQSDARGTVN